MADRAGHLAWYGQREETSNVYIDAFALFSDGSFREIYACIEKREKMLFSLSFRVSRSSQS